MKITRTRRLANAADVHANSSGDKSGMELEIEESEEQRGRGEEGKIARGENRQRDTALRIKGFQGESMISRLVRPAVASFSRKIKLG